MELGWVSVAARASLWGRRAGPGVGGCSPLRRGLLLVAASLRPSTGAECPGFRRCSSWALEHRLRSCMERLPGSGIKPTSPALGGERLTAEPPGKPRNLHVTIRLGSLQRKTESLVQKGGCLEVNHPWKGLGRPRWPWAQDRKEAENNAGLKTARPGPLFLPTLEPNTQPLVFHSV